MRAWLIAREFILAAFVFATAHMVLTPASTQAPFHQDESNYIWMSRYFYLFFIKHDLDNPEWNDWYWSHTQPKLGPYIVGASLWADGYTLEQIPLFYDWEKGIEENRRLGRMPDDQMLSVTRRSMVVIAAVLITLLYLLVRAVGGPTFGVLGGMAAAWLALWSDPARAELVQTLIEAPSMCFIMLTALVSLLGTRRGRDGRLTVGWALAIGTALGLALATKLTALLSLLSILAWGGLLGVLAARRAFSRAEAGAGGRRAVARASLGAAWMIGRGWALAAAVAVMLFVLIDPHIWQNPPLHVAHFFVAFSDGAKVQQQAFPSEALTQPFDRARYVLYGAFIGRTASGQLGWPFEVLLAAIGLTALGWCTWLGWSRTGGPPSVGVILLMVLAYLAGPSTSVHLAWARYVIPSLLVGTVLSGLGVATLLRGIGGAIRIAISKHLAWRHASPGERSIDHATRVT